MRLKYEKGLPMPNVKSTSDSMKISGYCYEISVIKNVKILKALHHIVYKNLLCQKMVSDPASTGLAQDYRHSSRQCMYL